MITYSDGQVEEYVSLLPYYWTPAINPPEYDPTVSEQTVLCEYCCSGEAVICINFFLMPYLLCSDCVQLSIDDAHYAIGQM